MIFVRTDPAYREKVNVRICACYESPSLFSLSTSVEGLANTLPASVEGLGNKPSRENKGEICDHFMK